MINSVIYLTTHIGSGRRYIGKRKQSPDIFLKSKYYGSGDYIIRAIKKYGLNEFSREVIWSGDTSEVSEMERYFIREYNSLVPNGFNIAFGGQGGNGGKRKGYKSSIETKNKISENRKGKGLGDSNGMRNPDVRKRFAGHIVSEETRRKIKNNTDRSYTHTDEFRERISVGMKNLYANGYINNRKGFKKINGTWKKEN